MQQLGSKKSHVTYDVSYIPAVSLLYFFNNQKFLMKNYITHDSAEKSPPIKKLCLKYSIPSTYFPLTYLTICLLPLQMTFQVSLSMFS